MISVCVLCYGDYEGLARCCLGSVLEVIHPRAVADLRVGLNAVSDATRRYVKAACRAACVPAYLWDRPGDWRDGAFPKYPLMRRMFYHPLAPLADVVMWFDDDSRLTTADESWWARVSAELTPRDVGQVGQVWYIRPTGRQEEVIAAQPWYTGKPVVRRVKTSRLDGDLMEFATGGWWAAKSALLRRWDYPFPALYHNGGDVMLGQMLYQQGYRVARFSGGVEVNASKRRGLHTPPLWADGGGDLSLAHHDFAVLVEPLNELAERRWPCVTPTSG